jgi:2-oxoglutarate ferredoxin oxidoreductase subunit alpha
MQARFGKNEAVLKANSMAFKAGHAYGETAELGALRYEVKPAAQRSGIYTSINGNTALAWGLVAAGQLAKLPVFLGSYPITPASDILHELAKHKSFGVRTLQAEDEIAGIGTALGAAFGGNLAVTSTSGPGVALKSETMSLAVSLELPLVVIDIQRGGPSTGLPTKTEAADLLMAMYGRHSEAPLPIVASYSPSNCFDTAIEACRIALKYRTPVILLSDGYLANGSEPWLIPDVASLPDISTTFATETNHINDTTGEPEHWPYVRDPETLARSWALPGTPGLMHRIGGIEKEDGSGNISYTPENHGHMVATRAAKIAGIAKDIPLAEVTGDVEDAELLVLGWGSTWGAIVAAVDRQRAKGRRVAHVHLTHLNPFPSNLGEVLKRYPKVLVPEMNSGHLARMVRADFLVDARTVSKVEGVPFTAAEVEVAIQAELERAQ